MYFSFMQFAASLRLRGMVTQPQKSSCRPRPVGEVWRKVELAAGGPASIGLVASAAQARSANDPVADWGRSPALRTTRRRKHNSALRTDGLCFKRVKRLTTGAA